MTEFAAEPWDEIADLVIVGSGGGSMCAALLAKTYGKSAIILEKQSKVGGSTGYSGGVIWAPCNPLMIQQGATDSFENARRYFDAAAPFVGAGDNPARRDAYVRSIPEMIDFLQRCGLKLRRSMGYPDYYDELPGGAVDTRTLVAELFDINELGDWKNRLSVLPGPKFPMHYFELIRLTMFRRTWAGVAMALRVAGRIALQKLTGTDLRGAGGALQGRMLQIALREGIKIWTETPVDQLLVLDGRVVGVTAKREGRSIRVQARDGVLLNVGGFAHNAAMRSKFGPQPPPIGLSLSNPGDTGEMIEAAMQLGAEVDGMDMAWWAITSRLPGTAADKPVLVAHHFDISYPHSIVVDQDGRRFADEAGSYVEIVERMYRRNAESGRAIPAWAIIESRHRARYAWGTALFGGVPKAWLANGYMKRADSLQHLASQCAIDPAGLVATVERFNSFARTGTDLDFNRGGRGFDRDHGDSSVHPNPNLGSIERPPFYAVALYPGDVGTAGGLLTDEHARVLRADGTPILGLYATGNSTASVFGRTYVGAGASIGASFVFGYAAAKHALGRA